MLWRDASFSNVLRIGCHTAWPLRPLCVLRKTLSQSQTHSGLRGHAPEGVWHPVIALAPLFLSVICCVTLTDLAIAQQPPATQPARASAATSTSTITEAQRATLRDLGGPSYPVREQAMATLLADESLTPEAIVELFTLASSPEQRTRLRQVAQHHVIRRLWNQLVKNRSGTGSLGVIQQSVSDVDPNAEAPPVPDKSRGAVRVVRTLPGFPGAVYLRPGDVISAVNGTKLADAANGRDLQESFRDMVIRSKAGETLRLTVMRDNRETELIVKLAPAEALQAVYGRTGLMLLEPPYRERWAEFGQKLDTLWPESPAIAVPWPTNLPAAGAAPVENPDANAIGLD